MERVCRQGDGLFPAPKDIELSCSCPDSARMCKHVAAVLYGVGARLDDRPEHLFSLRAVDTADLISSAGQGELRGKKAPAGAKVLAGDDVSALFGLEMADMEAAPADAPVAAAQGKPTRKAKPPARPPNAAPEKPAGAKLKGKTAAQPAKAPPKRPAGAQPKSKPATPARAARSAMASKPARARRQPTAP